MLKAATACDEQSPPRVAQGGQHKESEHVTQQVRKGRAERA
ncbi:MAG: hypothetical protein KatS3mg045_1916 [Bellilinea sp.]|nr:MAG: hypothetical protein KatS3mg045_1916 [Bellilinea sp.]